MSDITDKLEQLLCDYAPDRLIILGDLVHDRAAEKQAQRLIEKLGGVCELIVIAGNHDRHLKGTIAFVESWQSERFHFFHGHCAVEKSDRIQIIGHYHPAGVMWDGAGLRLKFPAFVQQGNCWIMPAFSPWEAVRLDEQRRELRLALHAEPHFAVGILYRSSAFRAKRPTERSHYKLSSGEFRRAMRTASRLNRDRHLTSRTIF